ncbi:MAG: YdcF family protein [Ruminococcaceae bacterium]|nr:YdcF family protein [Oscillospiraceae bacterium]
MKSQKRERTVRLILGGAGLCLFVLFLPAVSFVFNVGTIAGLMLSFLIVLAALFYPVGKKLVSALAKRRGGRVLMRTVCVLCALFVLYALIVGVLLVMYAFRAPIGGETVIVLGCKVNGERPSGMLIERLDIAAAYLDGNPSAVCIVSGGQGEGEDIPEALAMYRYLTGEKGISPDRVLMEDRSKNTVENLRFSAAILREKGLSPDVAVVTNGFHQFRAAVYAAKAGLDARAVNVPTGVFALPTFYVRELIGVAVLCLTGGRY